MASSPVTSTAGAHALASLIAFQSARLPARVDERGEIVLLEDQDRSLWDPALISLGFAHLERSASGSRMTTYHVQAAIAAAHTGPGNATGTPWPMILRLYDDLVTLNPSPLVRLNRVVAIWKVQGLDAALAALASLEQEPALRRYYLLPAVKGRLLAARGDQAGARRAFESALALPCSEPERRLLRRQISDAC